MRVNLQARAAAGENRRAQTRERLVDAAIAVIAERGPDAVSIEDFVAAAKVSRGTFYNYFPTIDDLIQAVVQRIAGALSDALNTSLPESLPPAIKLAARLHAHLALVRRDRAWGWVVTRLESTALGRQPALEANFDRIFREGVAAGDFNEVNIHAARTIVFGASRMAQRDILMEIAGPDHAEQVIALLLTTLGMAPDAAARTSRESADLAAQA